MGGQLQLIDAALRGGPIAIDFIAAIRPLIAIDCN
jgi:hypothetical protein